MGLNRHKELKEELQIKSIIKSSFKAYNHNSFCILKKEPDVESDVTGAPSSFWIETIRGSKTPDKFGSTYIQIDQKG